MGNRTRKPDDKNKKPTPKLTVKKETIRQLETLTEHDLQQAAGGAMMPSRAPGTC